MLTPEAIRTMIAVVSFLWGLLGLFGALSVWRRPEVYAIRLSRGQEFVLFLYATANLTLAGHAALLLPRFPLDMTTVALNVIAVVVLRFINGLFVTGLRWHAQLLHICIGAAIVSLAWQAGIQIPAWVPWPF